MYRQARKYPRIYCRDYLPKVEIHWLMSVPQNINELLKKCSKKRRHNLTRSVKKLEKEFPNQVAMVTYTKESEVELAINHAYKISSLTYQHAFGGGIFNDNRTRMLFKTAAKKGWFRMHILYIKDEPCAFRYRLKYRGTYFAEAIGYSPNWKRFSVGNVLFYKVMEEICGDPTVQRLDFGFGDGYHKQWDRSNFSQEASLYIFAPGIFPAFVNLIKSFATAISLLIEYITKKLGWFNFVQRHRHQRALLKSTKSKKQVLST
jgi:hypothetical protein